MTERYIAHSGRGEAVIRTNNRAEAERYAAMMNGTVTDREEA